MARGLTWWIAIIAMALLCDAAVAATVTVTPTLVGYWPSETALANDDPSSAIPQFGDVGIPAGAYEMGFRVSLQLSAADIAAGYTGFGDASFDLNQGSSALPLHWTVDSVLGPDLYDLSIRENSAATKFVYTDITSGNNFASGTGAAPSVVMLSAVDKATQGDFKNLSIQAAAGVYGSSDARLTMMQSSQNSTLTGLLGNPLLSAVVFADYDGQGNFFGPGADQSNGGIQPFAEPVAEGFSLHNNTTGLNTFFPVGTPGQTYTLNLLGVVPEPASFVICGASIAFFSSRRRTERNIS